jgi:hypothetical protein
MANNRMFLVNTRTGGRVSLAKYYPSTGWFIPDGAIERVSAAFDEADFGHLNPEAREAKAISLHFGQPYSMGGMFGDEWVLEFGVSG